MNATRLAQAIVDLDAWLQTMRQSGGYGGPVAHWWQNRYRYTGPGLDWRYEGILAGYSGLYEKTGETRWRERLQHAAGDVMDGQHDDGGYRSSRFEINPGRLGTPHEAAATLGLLIAHPHLAEGPRLLESARRNLDHLIADLWDGSGFRDARGVTGRVPNKLATMAHALMAFVERSGDPTYLPYAQAALDAVVHYQVPEGANAGAIHQYAPSAAAGDGRFFPYYAARCIPPLVEGARRFDDARYRDAAEHVLEFLQRTMHDDGSWPQVVYATGQRAEWPRWIAATADVLLAYHSLDAPLPAPALDRLLSGQAASGGFLTAQGFSAQVTQRRPEGVPDHRDVTTVVGWNDKVLRLLVTLVPIGTELPAARVADVEVPVAIGTRRGEFRETSTLVEIVADGEPLYRWAKHDPWASRVAHVVDVR